MPLLQEITNSDGKHQAWAFFCPACKWAHEYDGRWTFNDNQEKPTFNPSLRVSQPGDSQHCHLHVRDGNIIYERDSNHALAGQTIQMVEFRWSDDDQQEEAKASEA